MSAQRIELTIRREGHPDMTVPLPSGSIHIGRAEDNGLVLPDIAVSRRHARLHVSSSGVSIEDVGSGNGTYFEGKPIRKRDIEDADEILIDPFVLVFSIPSSPEREATDAASSTSTSPGGPPRVAGVARLVSVHGTGMRPEYPIRDSGLSMGRAEQRDVVLPDPAASRSHAEITKDGDGWLLKDFGSVNGTFVNSKRVRDHRLVDGDRIRIGATEFRFEAPKGFAPAAAEAPPPEAPSHGTRPFENLIFGLDGGAGSLPEGLGSDQTYVPKRDAAPLAPKPPSLNTGEPRTAPAPPQAPPPLGAAPPPPPPSNGRPLPGDQPNFSTKAIPPGTPGMPPPAPPARPAPPAPPAPSPAPPPALAGPPSPAAPPALAAPPSPHMAPPPAAAPVPAPPGAGGPNPFAAPAPLSPPPGSAPTPMGIPGAPPAPASGFAPLAPPPGGPPAPTGGGFGGVEMDMGNGGKRKKGRKMKMASGGRMPKGPKQGTFLQRNIGKLTGGFAVLALLLFSIGFIKNNSSDTPTVKRQASSESSPSAELAATSTDAQASQAAIDSLLGQGNALFAEKKYLEAVEKYAAVQKLSPNNATATKMGYHACEFMVVQAMYNTITQRSSTMAEQQESREAALALANDALSNRGNLGQATTAVQAALEFFPDDGELRDLLSRLQSRRRGVVQHLKQREQEEHAASISDLFAAAQGERDRNDEKAAIQGFERVLAADPEKKTDYYWKAEDQIREIKAELATEGRAAYRAGLSAMKTGDYLTARSQFRETLRLDPYNQVAQRRLDEVQAKLDQLAQKFWSEAEIYEKTNQLEMAIGRYRKVMEYSASSSSPLSQKAKKRIDALIR
jgi:pSer/pThr/pTyr-binding forkhead associated (FHA) protein/tetratricopeptide (TPR) repeat protein